MLNRATSVVLLMALWLSVQPAARSQDAIPAPTAIPQFAMLDARWDGDTLVVFVRDSGCLLAMPGDTGTGLCDFSGLPWEARIGRFGDAGYASGVSGRWYELERGGRRVARVELPPFAVLWMPWVAKE